MPDGLSPRQREMLNIIRRSIAETGVTPSYRELMGPMGFTSTGAVHRVVMQLEARGHIRRLRDRARSITVTSPPVEGERLTLGAPTSFKLRLWAQHIGECPNRLLERLVQDYLILEGLVPQTRAPDRREAEA